MTKYATGNPVGSTDPRDLLDNSQSLDEAVVSEEATFIDRLGNTRLTIKGMELVFDGGGPAVKAYYDAKTSADQARSDADRAESARDAAFTNANLYGSEADGLLATQVGEQFQVLSVSQGEYIRYRHGSGGVTEEVGRYPAPKSIAELLDRVEDNNGTESAFVFTDNLERVLMEVERDGVVRVPGMEMGVQNDAASSYIFRAMRYERAGQQTEANYWYDFAENANKIPLRLDAMICPNGTDGSIQRMAGITKIRDGRLMCFWSQIRTPNVGDNEGVRLVCAPVDYDLKTREISVGAVSVIEEPADWVSRLGFAGHPHAITLPSGRILLVYNINDAPDGKVDNRVLNIYQRHSDDGGETWSNKTLIAEPPGTETPRIIVPGSAGDFVRIPSGPYEGRIIFPIWEAIGGPIGAMYSDDEGASWTKSATFMTPGYGANESGLAWRHDGSLIIAMRTEAGGQQVYATSSDGGESWVFEGEHSPGWTDINVARSIVQGALSLDDGFEKILWSSATINQPRRGLVLRTSYDGGLTYQSEYKALPEQIQSGYSCVRMISDDVVAVVWENGTNSTNSIRLYIANMKEVLANGYKV